MLKQQPPWRLFVITLILTLPVITVTYFSITTAETPKLIKRVFGEVQEPENTTENDEIAQNPQQNAAIKTTTTNRSDDAVKNLNQEVPVQNESLDITPSTYTIEYLHEDAKELPLEAKDLLTVSLDEWDLEKPINNKFLIIDFKIGNGWAIGNIRPDKIQTYTDESFVPPSKGFVLLEEKDSWELAYNGEETTADLLDKIPSEELSNETKQTIFYESYISRSGSTGKTEIQTTGPTTYYLPWPSDEKYSLNYDRLNADETANTGWHGSWPNTNQALDLKPASGSSLEVLTVTDGTITKLCKNTNGNQAYLQITASGTSEVTTIMHLDKTSIPSDLSYASEVSTGDYLGKLYNGSGDERSLNCPMISSGLHLHLGMPSKPVNFDQYTFTSNENGRVQVKDSSGNILDESVSLESTNGSTTPPPPSTTEPTIDEYGILHGERWNIMPPVDVTGDGKADLVSFDTLTGKIDVTRSYGNKFGNDPGMIEGWEVWREDPNYATESWRLLPLADATGDERADLIFYNRSTREVHVSAAFTDPVDGKDKFGTIRNWNQDTEYNENTWNLLAPADVTGDGKADLIAFQKTSTQVYVTPSTGTSFGDPSGGGYTEWNSNTGYDSTNWKLLNPTDITGDGKADLIAYRANQGKIDVTPSTGTNFGGGILGFNEWRTDLNYFTPTWEIQQPADATGDEKADIIFYNNSTTEIHVVPSEGLNGPKAYKWNSNTGYDSTNWRLLVSADVDGKNGADLVAYDVRSTKVDVTRSTGNTFGIAKYGFENWNSNSGYGAVWEKLDPADVTGDGKSDIITFHMNDGRIDVSRAVGNSYSSAEVWRSTNLAYAGTNWIRLAPADINNDSKADIVFFNTATTEVHIRLSNGNSFGTAVNWNANTGLDDPTWEILDPSDMDNNGAADLVARNKLTGEIKVCYSNYITFESCQTISNTNWTSPNWAMIAPGDINGDEYIDLIAYNANSQIMELRINNQIGGFNTPISFQTLPGFGTSTRILDPADVNGDEKDDIILFNPSNTEASVLISNGNGFGITPLIDSTWNYATGYDTTNWEILEPTDSTGDGKADLITIHINPAKAIYTQIDLTRSTGSTFGPGYTDFEVWNYNTGYN